MDSHDDRGCDELGRFMAERLAVPAEWLTAECERSESFRALCEEYALCADALARWRASKAPIGPVRQREYGECLLDLKQEIDEWLADRQMDAGVSADNLGGDR
jgi:hypothetical protein